VLRHGSEEAKREILPRIARGECFFAIGMSEANSGSDLASVRSVARPDQGGWRISGSKLWTSHAHRSHYLTVLCRTAPPEPSRHAGLSVLMVDLESDGVEVLSIPTLASPTGFNEVVITDVFVPEDLVLGDPGEGWQLITGELSFERSGPERFLSVLPLYAAVIELAGPEPDDWVAAELGTLSAELWTLRRMSLAVSALLDCGEDPVVAAAVVKDLGTRFEGRLVEVARRLGDALGKSDDETYRARLVEATLNAPGFTLRGGTNEILRGLVCRALGVGR
jgi:acyl-CoA dehydrogenase